MGLKRRSDLSLSMALKVGGDVSERMRGPMSLSTMGVIRARNAGKWKHPPLRVLLYDSQL
jgi:hypothetical protein